MITEAINRIIELATIRTVERNGAMYVSEGDRLQRLRPPVHESPAPLEFSNLDSLIGYIATNPDNLDTESLRLHVVSSVRVDLIGPLQPINDNVRFCYAVAKFYLPSSYFEFGKWMPLEEFIIGMQSAFVPTDQSLAVVSMLANIANEAIRTNKDDGFSQMISVKTGLTTKSEVTVKNPVELVPVSTFREVEQPIGKFILRLNDKGRSGAPLVGLFAADIMALRLAAVGALAKYLNERIEEEMLETRVMF